MAKRGDSSPRVYVDACVFLAYIKGQPAAAEAKAVLDFIDESGARLVQSTVMLTELAPRRGDPESVRVALTGVGERIASRSVLLVDVSVRVAQRAAQYREQYGMSAPDAMHLATAVLSKCDWLVTSDRKFPSEADGMPVHQLIPAAGAPGRPWRVAVQQTLLEPGGEVLPFARPSE